MQTSLEPGDVVWVIDDNGGNYIINEDMAPRAVIIREIPVGWHRVFMSWGDKTKLIDLPTSMLKKVD